MSSHAREKSAFRQVPQGRSLSQNLYRPKPQRFNVELSDLDLAEEDPVEVLDDQLKARILKAKNLTDEDPALVPADIAAIIYPSSQKPPRIAESLIKRAMSADIVGLSEGIAEALEWFRADDRHFGRWEKIG